MSVNNPDTSTTEVDGNYSDLINDLIIQLVRKEEMIYNKKSESYKFDSEKMIKFDEISQAIYSMYSIHLTALEVRKQWEKLATKFRHLDSEKRKHIPSGSGASNEKEWPFFQSLQFLRPYLKHSDVVSSIPKNPENKMTRNVEKENKLKEKEKETKLLEKILDSDLSVSGFSLNQSMACPSSSEELKRENKINNYMPMIKKSFKQVPEEKKEECIFNILCAATSLNKE